MFCYMVQYDLFICFVFQVKVRSREDLHSKVTNCHVLPSCKQKRQKVMIIFFMNRLDKLNQCLSDLVSHGVCPLVHQSMILDMTKKVLMVCYTCQKPTVKDCFRCQWTFIWQKQNLKLYLFLNRPIVLYYTEVGFQRRQEEFYKLIIGQYLWWGSSNRNDPCKKLLIWKLTSFRRLQSCLRLIE